MSTLDEIKKMQQEGKSEQEVLTTLRARGLSESEIGNTMSQLKIKGAVSGEQQPSNAELPPIPSPQTTSSVPREETAVAQNKAPATREENAQEGQPSMMSAPQPQEEIFSENPQGPPQQPQAPPQAPSPEGQPQQPTEETFYQTQPPEYPQQSAQTNSFSPDTISEISEQVVAEKLGPLKSELEKTINLRSTFDSKISYIEERLKRIETVIDKLQLSVLQKVGEYVTDVSDIKKEMVETQKSFKSLLEKKHPKTHKEHQPHKKTKHKK